MLKGHLANFSLKWKNHQVAPLLKNWRKCNKIIDYSTIFAHPEITGVAKEPENLENLKCVSLMRCFSPEFDKNSKNHRFLPTFCLFLHIFRIFSNLAEKQRMKLSNLKCLRFSSSFDTHATSGRAKIVGEKNFCQNSHSAQGHVHPQCSNNRYLRSVQNSLKKLRSLQKSENGCI